MKNITKLFCLFLCLSSFAKGGIKCVHVQNRDLPQNLSFKGLLKDAYRWSDKHGQHLTLITETGELPSSKQEYEDFRNAELFAYDYLVQKDSIKQVWKLHDFVKDCPVDLNVHFINNTFQITDLNKDGIGEIWVMYNVACYGDVSPLEMKIIMYQGLQKYAMRGRSKVEFSKYETEGGEYKFDITFLNGPNEFKEFAKKMWSNNVLKVWK